MENSKKINLFAQAFKLFLIGSVFWVLPGLLPSFVYDLGPMSEIITIGLSCITLTFFILSILKVSKVLST